MYLNSQPESPTVRSTENIKLHFDLVLLTLTALTFSAPSYTTSVIQPEARLLFVTTFLSTSDCPAPTKVSAQPYVLYSLLGHLSLENDTAVITGTGGLTCSSY